MYGWRARLGILIPSGILASEPEFMRVIPEGVSCHFHRFNFSGTGKDDAEVVARLKKAEEYIADAAELLCDTHPSVMGMTGTGVTFIDGFGHDLRLIKKMMERNGNLPTTTTSTSVVAALNRLGIKKVSIAMPYVEPVAKAAVRFIEASGFQVLNAKWLNKSGFEINQITTETVYHLAKEVDRPESEAIFLSCTAMHTFEVIEKLENDLQKPVISSNLATIWNLLRMAQINDNIQGYGRLLYQH